MGYVCTHSGGNVGTLRLAGLGPCFSNGLNSLEEALSIPTTTCSSRSSAPRRKWCWILSFCGAVFLDNVENAFSLGNPSSFMLSSLLVTFVAILYIQLLSFLWYNPWNWIRCSNGSFCSVKQRNTIISCIFQATCLWSHPKMVLGSFTAVLCCWHIFNLQSKIIKARRS